MPVALSPSIKSHEHKFCGSALMRRNLTSGAPRTPRPCRAFRIDRRLHLDLAYKRQHEVELAIRQELDAGPRGQVWEVRNLSHLDLIHDAAGNSVVVVLAYSRSCGSCKMVLQEYQHLSVQAGWARAGAVFCKHNVLNEFDHRSDVASMFKIRHVPSFWFFVNGALIDRHSLPDSRSVYRTSGQMERAMHYEMQQINDHIRKLVFRAAPSAQKSAKSLDNEQGKD